MKAILVIDFPRRCEECPLHYFKQGDYCCPTKKLIDYDTDCPLRPIPKKESIKARELREDWSGLAYSEGWNACIDSILGETE